MVDILKTVEAQCLPLGLIFGVFVGFLIPSIGVAFSTGKVLSIMCVVLIFFIAGLKLKTQEAKAAMQAYSGIAFGVVSILGLTCTLGSALTLAIPLDPVEFKLGMIIFFCMPCTINSGAVLAKQAGGNFALALLLTVGCNTLGVVTAPVLLNFFAEAGDVEFPLGTLIWKLALTVFAPLVCGKLAQEIKFGELEVKKVVAKNNKTITMISNGLLCMIPWMRVSNTVMEGTFARASMADMLVVFVWTAFVHVLFLIMNFCGTRLLGMEEELQKAVVMVGSSKTLPMALSVLTFLPEETGDTGLMGIPCIIAHLGQIVMDGFVASYWKEHSSSGHTSNTQTEVSSFTEMNASAVSNVNDKTPSEPMYEKTAGPNQA